MPHSDVSIAIIGGGLGALTATLSLLQAGFVGRKRDESFISL
jgi:anaerobic glycerol-3-phosphate dehydrogenase